MSDSLLSTIVAALTPLAPTLAAIVGWWLTNKRAAKAHAEVTTTLQHIDTQTNGRLEEALKKINNLEQRLFEQGRLDSATPPEVSSDDAPSRP